MEMKLKCIAGVSVGGTDAVLLKVWPEADGPDDPWGMELEAVGSTLLSDWIA